MAWRRGGTAPWPMTCLSLSLKFASSPSVPTARTGEFYEVRADATDLTRLNQQLHRWEFIYLAAGEFLRQWRRSYGTAKCY